MLENNKEYQAITSLEKTIEEADKTRNELEALKSKRQKIENVSMNPEHKFFPYGQTLNKLDEDGRKRTFLKVLMHAVYILIPYGILFALPLAGIYLLDMYNIINMDLFYTNSAYQFVLAGIYAVVIVITVLTVFKYSRWIWRGQTKRRFNRLRSARHGQLSDTFEESESQIRRFEETLESRVESLNKDIESLDEKLQKYHKKIEDNTMVPRKFIPDIKKIAGYFEDNRVKNIKDAINLHVAEKRQDRMFEDIREAMDKQAAELSSLKDVMQSIKSIEQKISERPVQTEKEYDSDEERVLDAKLKAARTKKERKKLEKKKKKLEKKKKKD